MFSKNLYRNKIYIIDNNRHRCYTALTFGRPGILGKHNVKRITIQLVAQACQPGLTLLNARPHNQLQTFLQSISDMLSINFAKQIFQLLSDTLVLLVIWYQELQTYSYGFNCRCLFLIKVYKKVILCLFSKKPPPQGKYLVNGTFLTQLA